MSKSKNKSRLAKERREAKKVRDAVRRQIREEMKEEIARAELAERILRHRTTASEGKSWNRLAEAEILNRDFGL
ncbi:MAG: hypothetical protein V3T26_05975 [candidate division NC10 bacterium]